MSRRKLKASARELSCSQQPGGHNLPHCGASQGGRRHARCLVSRRPGAEDHSVRILRPLTDIADYWYVAEDKILRDPAVGRTVNIIAHTMAEVNQALTRGEYFWTDILRDGVVLYQLPGNPFAQPKPMTAAEARDAAQRDFDARIKEWFG